MKRERKNCKSVVHIALILLLVSMIVYYFPSNKAIGASADDEIELRLIFTTDIHGQLNSKDYEVGADYSKGGLGKAYTLIQQARGEVPKNNSFTFDGGDVLYDYTTEYIFNRDQEALQPIYQAMSLIGYDAITLGNHEFDYDYDYLRSQLEKSGLLSKTVVSNVVDSVTGEHPFLENMMLTKKLTTTQGKEVEVKIGVIGETFPYLSTKGQNFTGVLEVQEVVNNVKTQAKKLREQGADVIVVLAHTGFGPANPTEEDRNVAYALTKIDEVDVVFCGHEHNEFPSDDKTIAYYKLPGIDKNTSLVNGKNIVMSKDRGRSIGVVGLTISILDDELIITNRKSEVRSVSEYNVTENTKISSLYQKWEDEFNSLISNELGSVTEGKAIENFTALVEDSSAMQMLNDAKRAYALQYIHTSGTKYKNYPVIAASSYVSYGGSTYLDYVNISGDITEYDLAALQKYNGYTALYEITGAQLKEWLEWSASAYETTALKKTWTNSEMLKYMTQTNLKSLIAEEWLHDWSTVYVFDGINYEINPLVSPRYNKSGTLANNTRRVSNITYNGQEVTDDMVLVLAVQKLAKTAVANDGVQNQPIYKGYVRTQDILTAYINEVSKLGSYFPVIDYNWKLTLPARYEFIISTSSLADEIVKSASWYKKYLGTFEDYNYYVGQLSSDKKETPPKVLATSTNKDITSDKVTVAVAASSKNEIKYLKYVQEDVDANYTFWRTAYDVKDNEFVATSNGIYTVYAEDINGNKAVSKVYVDNIYKNALAAPKVNKYTNRKTALTGTADPGSTIVVEIGKDEYETVVNLDGTFSVSLPAQKSGDVIYAYAKNLTLGTISSKVNITVSRTGPNSPTVYNANNTTDTIYGTLNDSNVELIAIIGTNVYVGSDEALKRYQNCTDLYNETYRVIPTTITYTDSGEFVLQLPVQAVDAKVKVYTIDHIYRRSRPNTVTVLEYGPNAPIVYEVASIENGISGKATSSTGNKGLKVFAKVGSEIYSSTTDKDGYFTISFGDDRLSTGQVIYVYSKDTKNGISRMSYIQKMTVLSPEEKIENYEQAWIDDLYTNDKVIGGRYDEEGEFTLVVSDADSNQYYTVETGESGFFEINLDDPLPTGAKVYLINRIQYGEIIDIIYNEVKLKVPSTPYLKAKVDNATKSISVITDIESSIVVTIGEKVYETKEFVVDESTGEYIFKLQIEQPKANEKISIYAYNTTGKSGTLKTEVIQVIPEVSSVLTVDTNSKVIKGTMNAIGKTKVYAQIGDTIYEGKVSKKGNISIKIPTQKKGTKINIWGENEVGKSIVVKVKVKKATTQK